MSSQENYFPRGSVEIKTSKKQPRRNKNKKLKVTRLFKKDLSADKRARKNAKRRNARNRVSEDDGSSTKLNSVTPLLYETLEEGFMVIGCIREIFSTSLTVTLPGHLSGQVSINKISDPLNKLLSSYVDGDIIPEHVPTLQMLFKVGELVTCCVESVTKRESGLHKVSLTLNPSVVNQNKTDIANEENIVLVGAIKSKGDYGYDVDLGMDGATAFLPFNQTTKFLELQKLECLHIGQVLKVAITKVIRQRVGNKVELCSLTIDPDVLDKCLPFSGFTSTNLIPGQRMKVFIKQIISQGLEVSAVHAKDDLYGYVHISHVSDMWGNTSDLHAGKILTATFLYSLEPASTLYFSLKSYSTDTISLPIEEGSVVENATVVSFSRATVLLRLGSNNLIAKGIVSLRQMDTATELRIGQSCKVRVLNYDHLEKAYVCSLKEDMLSKFIGFKKDVQIGQIIQCTVSHFKEGSGLVLKYGNMSVLAPTLHLADHPQKYSTKIHTRFQPNIVVTAKVLNISELGNIIVTLKPTLITSEALKHSADAVRYKGYYGMITKITNFGIVVHFFGNLSGLIPNRLVSAFATGYLKENFYRGQLIRCYVADSSQGKLELSLIPDAPSDLKLGASYNVKVVGSTENGLDVVIVDTELTGFIPINQVTDHVNLLDYLASFLTPGVILNNVVLYRFTSDITPLFSTKMTMKNFIESNPLAYAPISSTDGNIENLMNLNIPCSISKIDDSGITLIPPLTGFCDEYFLPKTDLENEIQEKMNSFKMNQTVVAQSIIEGGGSLGLSVSNFKFMDQFRGGIDILQDYLNSAALFQTVNIGGKVDVKVTDIRDDIVDVKLTNYYYKFTGSIKKDLYKRAYRRNEKFKAVVLWQDPVNQHCYLHPDGTVFSDRLENIECDSFPGQLETAQVLFCQDDFCIGLIQTGLFSGCLTVMPIRCHFNDFTSKKPKYLSSINILPCLAVGNFIISERGKSIKKFSQMSSVDRSEIVSELLRENTIVPSLKTSNCQMKKSRGNLEDNADDLAENTTIKLICSKYTEELEAKNNSVLNNELPESSNKQKKQKNSEINVLENSCKLNSKKSTNTPKVYDDKRNNVVSTFNAVPIAEGELFSMNGELFCVNGEDEEKTVDAATNENSSNALAESPNKKKKQKSSEINSLENSRNLKSDKLSGTTEVNDNENNNIIKSFNTDLIVESELFSMIGEEADKPVDVAFAENSSEALPKSPNKKKRKKSLKINCLENSDKLFNYSKVYDAERNDLISSFNEVPISEGELFATNNKEEKTLHGKASKVKKNRKSVITEEKSVKEKLHGKKRRKSIDKELEDETLDSIETKDLENSCELNGDISSTTSKIYNSFITSPIVENELFTKKHKNEANSLDVTFTESLSKKKKNRKSNGIEETPEYGKLPVNKKRKSIVVQELEDETLVFNESSDDSRLKKCKKTKESSDFKEVKGCKNSTSNVNCSTSSDNLKIDSKLRLSGGGSFFWDIDAKNFSVSFTANDNEDNLTDGDNDEENEQKKNKRPKTAAEKKAAAKEAEKRLRDSEKQLLEAESNPQSADHFERLALAQPNNSLIWIKYMAYHLQATEIEKARAVGNRALNRISQYEEQDRINVWVALLNLENLYGTEDSLKKTLEEAVRTNDEYKIYSKMIEIYTDSKKNLELDQLTNVMARKFKTDIECWLLCGKCLLRSGMIEKARLIFQKGLQNILKKEHVQYITRFALLENSYGSSEHAQTLMEHVLTTYPGRLPAWTSYIDMLIKSERIDLARNVLERAVGQKLPVKKMKTLYKTWLQFEEKYGTATSVNHVREAAENYINSFL